jgi:hypothetical protein
LRERPPRLDQKDLAGGRQPLDAVGALDKVGPKLVLDPPDGSGERRLRHVEACGGAPEAAFLGDSHELSELAEFEHGDTFRISYIHKNGI